ncbi:type IV pilus biogenesis/stability protein PilW [Marinobacterium sp. 3-1745]|uniref:Type IV pilus biogenesis/stability protein PilW n=1 Tax=Marinobacterium marinum TaxID=2756129 RepID=A0A7W1X0B7_9GAMM|nr:type IV pilus biogenesis/stability protein PilW [Marinobacterium marinum]
MVSLLLAAALLSGCASQSGYSGGTQGSESQEAVEAYTGLGVQYLQAGNTAQAKASLQRALSIDSDYPPAYNAMALVFQVEQEFKLAEKYFRKGVSANPDSAMLHNNFGAFLFALQRYEEACVELSLAARDPFYPQRAQTLENLGRCNQLIGRAGKAEESFKRSLAIDGNRPVALVELSQLLLDRGEYVQASRYFARFGRLIEQKQVEHYPKSLWVGIQLSRQERNASRAATYGLLLKNMFPQSEEYRLYQESAQ